MSLAGGAEGSTPVWCPLFLKGIPPAYLVPKEPRPPSLAGKATMCPLSPLNAPALQTGTKVGHV